MTNESEAKYNLINSYPIDWKIEKKLWTGGVALILHSGFKPATADSMFFVNLATSNARYCHFGSVCKISWKNAVVQF